MKLLKAEDLKPGDKIVIEPVASLKSETLKATYGVFQEHVVFADDELLIEAGVPTPSYIKVTADGHSHVFNTQAYNIYEWEIPIG